MYKIPLVEIKDKLMKSGKITPVDLESRIKKKINDLSGLISEEGAAHIIANELGVELFSSGQEKLKVKNIYAGMRSISTVGKVMRKFEVREFAKEKASGRVASLIIGDESGTIRVVFWNDQVKVWEQIKENDIIPFIIHIPNDSEWKGKIDLTLGSALDITPTLLDLLHIDTPNPFMGLSLLSDRKKYPVLLGDTSLNDYLQNLDNSISDIIVLNVNTHNKLLSFIKNIQENNMLVPNKMLDIRINQE